MFHALLRRARRASRLAALRRPPRARAAGSPSPEDLRRVDDLAGWTALFEPEVRVVVWRRPPDPARTAAIAGALAAGPIAARRFVFRPGPDAARAVAAAIPEDVLAPVAADALALGEALSELTGLPEIGVRLERADGAMCPRFHTDRVPARIVVTYCGPGTETVSPADVDASRLGPAGRGRADEDGLLKPGARIRRADAGDVVLMKGEEWPGAAGRGAIHRSPQTTAAEPRLVLTLDLV